MNNLTPESFQAIGHGTTGPCGTREELQQTQHELSESENRNTLLREEVIQARFCKLFQQMLCVNIRENQWRISSLVLLSSETKSGLLFCHHALCTLGFLRVFKFGH